MIVQQVTKKDDRENRDTRIDDRTDGTPGQMMGRTNRTPGQLIDHGGHQDSRQ